jgi:tetratricopeptide (TPR) repeat protein
MSEPASAAVPSPPRPAPRRRRRLYIGAAIVCGLLPVLALEAGLRLTDIGEEVTYQDSLVGFSRVSPLFECRDEEGVYRTARSHQVLFEEQQFAIEKPADGIRIFVLGGSSVRGRPYTTQTGFPRWLELELAARDPDHTYEVVNCGGLSYASYRLRHILEEVLEYEPDLIVLATGHNEFLEDRTYEDLKQRSWLRSSVEDQLHRLRTVRVVRELVHGNDAPTAEDERTILPELVEARLDQASGYGSYHRDDEWSAQVHHHFHRSIEAMVAMCRETEVPIVLVLLGSNVRDCPPFKSEHRPGLSLDEEQAWQAEFDRAGALEESDPQQALEHFQAAAQIDDEHALLRFRIARLLDRLGHIDEATGHYLAARDRDVCPLRMPESFAASLRKIAERTATPLVDGRGLIEAESDANLPGNDWYMDHVHPTIGGHQLIAEALTASAEDLVNAISLNPWSNDERRDARRRHLQSLGEIYLTNGYERVNWLESWAQRRRLLEDTLPRTPAAHLRYGHREWDFARHEHAWEQYRTAIEADLQMLRPLKVRIRQLIAQGRPTEAAQLVQRLIECERVPPDEADEMRTLIDPR